MMRKDRQRGAMHLVYQAEYDETPAVNSRNRVNWWKRGRAWDRERERKRRSRVCADQQTD